MKKVLVLFHHGETYTGEIVAAAMCRSFTAGQVDAVEYVRFNGHTQAAVLINPTDVELSILCDIVSSGGKVLVLGQTGPRFADKIGVELPAGEVVGAHWAVAAVDPSEQFNLSPVDVRYDTKHVLGEAAVVDPRPLCRYDFGDEWNNLGYGIIRCDGGPWAVSCITHFGETSPIAWLEDSEGRLLSAYAAVRDYRDGSALWLNRSVGPVDSLEWQMVEKFFGDYRCEDLPCYPYLSEIPWEYSGVVTMRLDCDQAVASARSLFDLYASLGLPFSMALSTGLAMNREDMALLREVSAKGGAIVPHSMSHHPNWGGSYETALNEARSSKRWIEENLAVAGPVRHTVSPFHQNPIYAVNALADAGYKGFVGGSIRNDPEYLLGRAGRVPFVRKGMVSHSQQCMLHGECYSRYGESVEVYQQSFEMHLTGRAIFGYLDHPFSEDYQYGWGSEQQRMAAHQALVGHILSFERIWWCSLRDCLDFLAKRDSALLGLDENGGVAFQCEGEESALVPAAWIKGECLAPQ